MRRRTTVVAAVLGVTIVAGIAVSQDWSTATPTAGSSMAPVGSAGTAVTPARSATASPSVGSAEALATVRTALSRVVGKNLRFTIGNGIGHLDGVYATASDTVSLTRVVDGHRYQLHVSCASSGQILLGGYTPDGTVLRIDSSRLPIGNELLPATAPMATLRLLAGVTRAAPNGADTYTVWLDLTRLAPAPNVPEQRLVAEWRTAAGERASQLEATVTVNGLGRLAGFRTVFPKADNGSDQGYEFAVTEADSTETVPVPDGTVADAPDSFYRR